METIKELNIKLDVIEDEIRVSTLTIAEKTGNKYDSVRRLVKKYTKELEEFGVIPTTDFKSEVGKQAKSLSLLNEAQSTLLITFLNNTPEVIKFKVSLIKAFFIMKDRLESKPQQNQDLMPMFEKFMQMQQKQNEQMLVAFTQTVGKMLENQTKVIMSLVDSIKNDIKDTSYNLNKYIYVGQENRADYITPDQADEIVGFIVEAAQYVAPFHKLPAKTTERLIFGKFNERFDIKTYKHLKGVNFDKAVAWIKILRDKARLETDESFRYIVDDIVDIMNKDED